MPSIKPLTPEQSPLGKTSAYIDQYDPSLLYPIPRSAKREEIGIAPQALPFSGLDIWHAYEISFLNLAGKPIVATGEIKIPCNSPNIIESKSFKLYLNSFNNTKIASLAEASSMMQQDLSQAAGSAVTVQLVPIDQLQACPNSVITIFAGESIDGLEISCDTYQVQPEFLCCEENAVEVTEVLTSNLLKSNCLVTGQPDWGSVQIAYQGPKISRAGLLRYLVSFRNHNEFHEQCVERIFHDLQMQCQPQQLSVQANYTRRGGLDICPFRGSDVSMMPVEGRLQRQ